MLEITLPAQSADTPINWIHGGRGDRKRSYKGVCEKCSLNKFLRIGLQNSCCAGLRNNFSTGPPLCLGGLDWRKQLQKSKSWEVLDLNLEIYPQKALNESTVPGAFKSCFSQARMNISLKSPAKLNFQRCRFHPAHLSFLHSFHNHDTNPILADEIYHRPVRLQSC